MRWQYECSTVWLAACAVVESEGDGLGAEFGVGSERRGRVKSLKRSACTGRGKIEAAGDVAAEDDRSVSARDWAGVGDHAGFGLLA
jgi:hypothetical protein